MEKFCILNRFKNCKFKPKNIKKWFKGLEYKKFLPTVYLFTLILGIVLTLVYSFIHSLVTCSSMFGKEFCTPTGIFLALLASMPGYLISGNLLSFIEAIPWGLSFSIVVGTSFVFYYLLGLFIDNFKAKKIDPENLAKIIIIATFAILLILVIGLI